MNWRLAWLLLAATLVSLALLLWPQGEEFEGRASIEVMHDGEAPELTIINAKVRAFGEDGTLTWTLESPRIAYYLDGFLDLASPSILVRGDSGSNLSADAGDGWFKPFAGGEEMSLHGGVDALLTNPEREVEFVTIAVLITKGGRQISASSPVEVSSGTARITAASLELDLTRQLLQLTSGPQQRVHTRIQPLEALR